MAYQILALDLDGTLTNSQKEITKPTLDALIEIQEAGKKSCSRQRTPDKRCRSAGRAASSGRLWKLHPFFQRWTYHRLPDKKSNLQ